MAQQPYDASNFADLITAIDDSSYTEKVINIMTNFMFDDIFEIPEGQIITIQSNPSENDIYILTPYLEDDETDGKVGVGLRHIEVLGALTLKNIILSGNEEVTGERGGVYVSYGATFTMESGSQIIYNQTLTTGGGVHNEGTFLLNGGSVSFNQLTDSWARGGGVYNGGTLMMTGNSTIQGNKLLLVGNGAGILNVADATFIMAGGAIIENQILSGGSGGGVSNYGTFIMEGGTINGNKIAKSDYYNGNGGGIYIGSDSTFEMLEGTLVNNEAPSYGGGISIYRSTSDTSVFFSGGRIENNKAYYGGGISMIYQGGASLMMDEKAVTSLESPSLMNSTSLFSTYASSISDQYISLYMNGGTLQKNEAVLGGGIYIEGDHDSAKSTFVLNKGKIRGNIASNAGGGMFINQYGEVHMNGGKVIRNEAMYGGGAYIYASGTHDIGLFLMNWGQLNQNVAELGGGIYIEDEAQFLVKDGIISNNKALESGGGIYKKSEGILSMEEGVVCYNKAIKEGGGIYTEETSYYNRIEMELAVPFKKNKTESASLFTGMDFENVRSIDSSVRDYYLLNNNDMNTAYGIPLTETFYDIFPDPNLAKAVAQALGANPDEYTWEVELESLVILEAPNQNIKSLENIKRLVNLSTLNLEGNQISDLRPLSDFSTLTTCNLLNQAISLDSVRVGVLKTSLIYDEESLMNLAIDEGNGESFGTTYYWYDAGENSLSWEKDDYYSGTINQRSFKAPIEKVFKDDNLALKISNILDKRATELIDLSELSAIKNLVAINKNIQDLEGIQFLVNLTTLSLNQNNITDLSQLAHLKLTTLELDRNEEVDLAGIKNIKTLFKLSLNDNGLTEITDLENLSNLETLSLKGNGVTSLNALSGFKHLTVLDVNDNEISDLTGVSFPNLNTLRLDNNPFPDLTKLPTLPKIEKLYLNRNGITSVTSLASLKSLKLLELNNNSDLERVADLNDLTELFALELNGNPNINQEDIKLLKKLPHLWFLNHD